MYAQQPPVELLHQCEREAGSDQDKSNKKGKALTSARRRQIKAIRQEPCRAASELNRGKYL